MKVDVIHNILWSHYKGRVFSALNSLSEQTQIHLTFIQIASTESQRVGLSNVDSSIHHYPYTLFFDGCYDDISLLRRLLKCARYAINTNADFVMLPGYYRPEFWLMLAVLRFRRIPRGVFCDSTQFDARQIRSRTLLRKLFFSQCCAVLTYGERSSIFARMHGVADSVIFSDCQAAALPDNYSPATALLQRLSIASLRDRARPHYLFVGRLAAEKGLHTLIQALARVITRIPLAHLTIVGNGPLSEELINRADSEGLHNNITFAGSVATDRLPQYYLEASALVLPSTKEPWGLVVNEALAFGCPVIVSDICGCVPELVATKGTGIVFSSGNAEVLARSMLSVPDVFADVEATARRCISLIGNYTPHHAAQRILAAFQTIAKQLGP